MAPAMATGYSPPAHSSPRVCALLRPAALRLPARPYRLNNDYQSASQNERIAFLILHYTDEDDGHSLRLLTEPAHQVSAHYLIPRDTHERPLPVYQLVPDSQRAWHAGRSRWHQYAGLNASSLGIGSSISATRHKTSCCPPTSGAGSPTPRHR